MIGRGSGSGGDERAPGADDKRETSDEWGPTTSGGRR
jgi:hypothetical protein